MKLVSTDIREGSIELTYADGPDLDDASTLLIARLPKEIDEGKSLAWNRYWTLMQLQDEVQRLIAETRATAEKNR